MALIYTRTHTARTIEGERVINEIRFCRSMMIRVTQVILVAFFSVLCINI